MKTRILIALLIVLIVLALTATVFEDGSFILLGGIKGCLPFAICNL